jgi:hypothetical protein
MLFVRKGRKLPMIINLESLPIDIYKKIPLSIKTYKKEYELNELPYDIQLLIGSYSKEKEIVYTNKVYDFKCDYSEYGDFTTISNLRYLVIDYMNNYLRTLLGEYPFNGSIGSNVKKLLQKKDTTTQRLFMTEELDRMIRTFGPNIDKKISVNSFDINKSNNSVATEYTINIVLNIDDVSTNINTSFIL